MNKNSLDLLRLLASTMVLFSHQFALMGLSEPQFMGWNTWGGAGVTIFFFLSGWLVWASWERDPHAWRFFLRRSLRIFPGLWVVCLLSIFLLGPLVTTLSLSDYFGSAVTWRYFWTALFLTPYVLPGVFVGNAMPGIVNGSLWTLPVEYFCYITVAVIGAVAVFWPKGKASLLSVGLLCAVLFTHYGVLLIGERYSLYFEMVAMFWWGVFYGHCLKSPPNMSARALAMVALVLFVAMGPRGLERSAMLVCAAALVHWGRQVAIGAKLTDRLGDLSYGVYIYAFPIQQLVIGWGRGRQIPFGALLAMSLLLTWGFAYLSWHVVEARALRFKPMDRGNR